MTMPRPKPAGAPLKLNYYLMAGLSGVAALAVGVPVVSAVLAPLLQPNPQTWRKVGTPADLAVGSTHLVKFENANPVA